MKTFYKFIIYLSCYFANWAAKRRSPISKCEPGITIIAFRLKKNTHDGLMCYFFKEDVDPFLCTHINFAFAKVGEDLQIKPYEEDDTQGWTGGPGMYDRIHKLRQNNTRLKIMLSIGGWTHASKGFNDVVKTDSNMFVMNLFFFAKIIRDQN